MLNQNARYLAALGDNVTSVDDLWNFEVQQAVGYSIARTLDSVVDSAIPTPGLSLSFARRYDSSIQSRYGTGPFGRGWFSPWQTRINSTFTYGVGLAVDNGGSSRTFVRDARNGSFFSGTGDSAQLTLISIGVYELRAIDGSLTRFRQDGQIDYVKDTNNNRVTVGYNTNGRMISLTHSSGAILSFAYNATGRIATLTDSAGRVTTYGYDPTNSYLVSVTTADGKITRYAYETAGNVQNRHALRSIERGGTTQFFDYDSRGRLDASYLTGNAQFVDYAYNDTGMVTVADSAGTTQLYFDHNGLLAKAVDPLGFITSNDFDDDLRLKRTISPTGESQSYAWCTCGSISSVTNELGYKTTFAYDNPFKRMTSFTDAKGNRTQYTYDTNGNFLTTVYPNGSVERLSNYTLTGLPGVSANRRGQPLSYTYNAAGQVTRQTFADSAAIIFEYDARSNLMRVTDGSEITLYTYNPTVDGDRLKRITYPNGRYLDYTYDIYGRRIQMIDQDGFATKYEYDAAGRLYRLRDTANVILVTYGYDSSGRLSRVDKGNGTFTTYEYDPAGQLLSLKNWRNATTLNSKFEYSYDSRGRRTSMDTLDGKWTYVYDATGQLTRALFASLNTAVIANQDLQYLYDAVGSRTRTLLNGVTTLYNSNNLNQYTRVGSVNPIYNSAGEIVFDGVNTYSYDQQSRLTNVSGPNGLTQYEYNFFGNRTAKIENGIRTEYLLDLPGKATVVGEYVSAQPNSYKSIVGLGLVAQIRTNGVRIHFDFDGLGSTVGMFDSTGTERSKAVYEPFGKTLFLSGDSQVRTLFGGQRGWTNETSGQTFLGRRFFNNETGNYTIPSTASPTSVATKSFQNQFNSPTNFLDFDSPLLCPPKKPDMGNLPTGWRNYDSAPGHHWLGRTVFHCGYEVILEVQTPSWAKPKSECAYDETGELVTSNHKFASCGGTMNYCTGLCHFFSDPGGMLLSGPAGIVGSVAHAFVRTAFDPNQKLPEMGFGAQTFVASTGSVPYRIDFENYSTATAPAQYVTITDNLSTDFDWTTFRLTEIGFGDQRITIPANKQVYQTTRSMTYNGKTFDVLIEAGILSAIGQVYAFFESIDPTTQLPPEVLIGFLPPEDGTGRGLGHVSYTIRPKAGLATGTEIRNIALISFDGQLAIATDQVDPLDASKGIDLNKQARITIDAGLPSSVVNALPAISTSTSFPVSWSGSDDVGGSGIAGYDVYVSRNGGAYSRLLSNTASTSTTFAGAFGNSYRFYSSAIDNTGQRQPVPVTAHSQTQVVDPRGTTISITSSKPSGLVYGQSVDFTVSVTALLATNPTPTGNVQFLIDGVNFGSPIPLVNGSASIVAPRLNAGQRIVTVQYTSTGGIFDNSVSNPFTQTVNKASLTLTAQNAAKLAGEALPSFVVDYSGFIAGDNIGNSVAGIHAVSASFQAVGTAGSYAISVSTGTLVSNNYSFVFVSGTLIVNSTIAGRSVYYGGTVFDTTAGSQGALDTTKRALLPGQTASFANYTNFVNGLTSFIVDLVGLPGIALAPSNFQFATWNAISPDGFVALAAVPTITVLPNQGSSGSTRVKVQFEANTIRNTWLRVSVVANNNTWLRSGDVFYFGSAVGDMDVGNTATEVRVNAIDTGFVRNNQSPNPDSVGVTNTYDVNKDGRVNSIDTGFVRLNQTNPTIGLFTAPGAAGRSMGALKSINAGNSTKAAPGFELGFRPTGMDAIAQAIRGISFREEKNEHLLTANATVPNRDFGNPLLNAMTRPLLTSNTKNTALVDDVFCKIAADGWQDVIPAILPRKHFDQ